MYFCTPNPNEGCSTISSATEGHQATRFLNNATQDVESGGDSVAVVHLDMDGGEEPAVTTDVMFSGMSIKHLISLSSAG